MKISGKNKLNLFVKVCIFYIFIVASGLSHAEYYLVYSAPEYTELCSSCTPRPHHHRHHYHHRVAHHHYRYHRSYGIYAYYPRPRVPCPPPVVRSVWGDYVVFSARPTSWRHTTDGDENLGYSEDQRTADDNGADMEIN